MAIQKIPAAVAEIVRKGREWVKPQEIFRYGANVALSLYYRKLREVPEKLAKVTAGLKAASDGVEEKFLEMGQTIQTIYADSAGLTRQIQETTQALAGTGDDNILGKVEALADNSQKALVGHQDRVATNLAPVKAVIDYLESLCQSCDQIDRIAMNLRVVGLNIGVESTRSAEARDMFTIVAEEIVQLSNKVNAAGTLIRGDAEAAKADEVHAVESITKGLQELESLSTDAAKAVNAAVTEIQSCVHSATTVFDQSCKRSDAVSQQVGEIVAGIQFHDSMRQRVEHIVDALATVAQKMSRRTAAGMAAGSITARLGEVHDVGAIQMMQLRDVIHEIERVHGQSAGAFQSIGNEMQSLTDSMKVSWSETSTEALGKGAFNADPFERLLQALEQLKDLMVRADFLVDEIERSVLRSSEIGTRFSGHMKTVEIIGFETHMKALNAIVRAAHLGEKGQTLEVLAQEMSRLSRQARDFVANVVDNLGQMANCATKLRQEPIDVSVDPESVAEKRGEAADTLGRGIDSIRENKSRLAEQLGAAARRAEALREEITHVIKGLTFLPSLADDMTGCLDELKSTLEPLKPFGEKTQGDTDQLSAAYTMQRERDIHEKLFLGDNPAGRGFVGNTIGAIGNDRSDTAEAIELFGDPNEEKKEGDAKDFGDNVELF
jgi:methyl-accepting chemotaxis protein